MVGGDPEECRCQGPAGGLSVSIQENLAREAERRISEAAYNQAKVLDLSHLQLSAVPESIGQLTGLTRLDLSYN
jgi:Leucine-rich repeat (LRR) protein